MFSNRIANSAKFLQMPTEAQLLYFHMILRADDDGVVESYPLIKMLGVPIDNFKVLLTKGMIKILNEDQVIVITDWLEHNKIRADRKVDSIYLPLLRQKHPELPVLDAQPRADTGKFSGRPVDSVSQVKLSQGKLREENASSFKKTKRFYKPNGLEMRYSANKWWVLPSDGGDWLEFAGNLEKDTEIKC